MTKIVITLKAGTLWLLIVLLATGCASLSDTRDTASVDAPRNAQEMPRAKRVFLYQSRVANALLDRYPLLEILENAAPEVVDAEARMAESCSALSEAVLTEFEGKKLSLKLRFRVMRTIDDCESATRNMDELLNRTAIADSI